MPIAFRHRLSGRRWPKTRFALHPPFSSQIREI
jgi:hypothetical protein